MSEVVVAELDALRALARALVHGDAEADDLVQDTALAALEHPPALDRPVRPWLATVLRNRWRMDHRGETRRRAREAAAIVGRDVTTTASDELLARAQTFERLGAALVALDEPFRATVMLRYLDGQSCAAIARAAGVPDGTVRWRLATGLARLRTALDARGARSHWQRALVPAALPLAGWGPVPAVAPVHAGSAIGHFIDLLQGAALVKVKTTALAAIVLVLLALGGAFVLRGRHAPPPAAPTTRAPDRATLPVLARAPIRDRTAAVVPPRAPHGRASVEAVELAGGAISGRVVNWSTGDGVPDADLTFTSAAGASTIRTHADGAFRLTPPTPGTYALATAAATGFLPYAPELAHSSVRVAAIADREVSGVTVFLYPALDYHGTVIDRHGAIVAGAHVRVVGTPANEQAIDQLATEWTADRAGAFTFHATDNAVLEADSPSGRGWARLDGGVAITKQLVITVGDAPPRDATITGTVVDAAGHPVADALVHAEPVRGHDDPSAPLASAFATSAIDGTFAIAGLARGGTYDVGADADDHAPVVRAGVAADSTAIMIAMDAGIVLAGRVVTTAGEPVPAYTLLVMRRTGVVDDVVTARSIVDARGQFAVHVAAGDYQLVASAAGWAPSARTSTTAIAGVAPSPITITVSAGATLRGTVTSAVDNTPIPYARVTREGVVGGASAQPANAGTVTAADGSFELAGIPAGPLTIQIGADSFHPALQAGLDAHDDADLPPVQIALAPLTPGESPTLDLVGIGVKLVGVGTGLRVDLIVPDSGAAAAGMQVGDIITAVDTIAVTDLGMTGAIEQIRGIAGTTVAIAVQRGDRALQFTVERRKLRA